METFLNQLKNGTLMMNKPNANGYYYAIGCSILVYVALCVLVFLTYEWWNWMLFVIAGLLIVIFSIFEFHLVKALLAAREEVMKPYHKAEQKLVCVYEKLMDYYVEAAKKELEKSNNPTVKERIDKLAVDAYLDGLKKVVVENPMDAESMKNRVNELVNKDN